MTRLRPRRTPPSVGDRVVLRGRGAHGKLMSVRRRGWCRVVWDLATPAPMIVHIDELDTEPKPTPPTQPG